MSRSRTAAAALAAAAVTALGVLATGQPTGAAPAAASPPVAARAAAQHQVTLLTGDRVTVVSGGAVQVHPAKGREHVRFTRSTEHGDTYVVPSDAAPLVARHRVDKRLFDVTALVRFGYDDAARDDIPLILTHAATAAATTRARVAAAGGEDAKTLPDGRVSTATATKSDATRLWGTLTGTGRARLAAAPVDQVWLDGKVQASLDVSVPQIGAPAAWAAGHTGAGTTVAVLDSGLDAAHPDLADAVVASQDFDETGTTQDGHGHGTHVASIITGNGAASGGKYKGVAPDAKLLIGKVLDDTGGGYDSWIIAGMQWAAAQHADVVNMSLGGWPSDGDDPMDIELNRLTEETGTLFVVAAGNSGPYAESVGSPGAADDALTVGAVDSHDALADFSSRGPRYGDGAIKPDITAPGVGIVAARAAGSTLGEPVGDAYQRLSGTSMAAPHVAGAAAILAGEHPTWTPEQLKAALMNSAEPTPGATVFDQGAGRVDVARATTQDAYATPASLSEGTALWPHQDDPAITRTVTYHNDGAAPLTLALTTAVTGPAGAAAPAGMFAVSAPSVTVPAHGSAAVTLTTRTTVAAPDGRYSGALVATGGSTVLRTPLAVTREVESYDVTAIAIDRTGAPTPNWYIGLVSLTADTGVAASSETGRVTFRVPKGVYYQDTFVQPAQLPEDPYEMADIAYFWEPTVRITGPRTIRLDARTAEPVGVHAARPAEAGQSILYSQREAEWGGTGVTVFGMDFEGVYVKPSTTTAPAGQYHFGAGAVLARRDAEGGFARSPYQYHLGFDQDGRVPADLDRRWTDAQLGVVRTVVAAPGPGLTAQVDGVTTLPLPGTLTELFTPGFPWNRSVYDYAGSTADLPVAGFMSLTPSTYRAGAHTTERFGFGVLGPGFNPVPAGFDPDIARNGDTIAGFPVMHTDADGHNGYLNADAVVQELYRDGELVTPADPSGGFWNVPAGPATYKLVVKLTGSLAVSTRVAGEWTFRSGHVDGEDWAAQPALAVRFDPRPAPDESVPGGRTRTVAVTVQKQGRAAYGTVRTPTVRVSYDEGRTWTPAPVTDGQLKLTPPAGATSVSLRATASDSKGTRIEQTVIKAYLLR